MITDATGAPAPTLGDDHLRLRALTPDDAEPIHRLFASEESTRFWSHRPLADRDAGARWIAERLAEADTRVDWVVEHAGAAVGVCFFSDLSPENRRAEIGYAIAAGSQGRGFATGAVGLALAHGFDTLSLHRVEADVDPRNTPSLRLLERFGFVAEGRLRDRWQVTGEVQDTILLGLLEPDWRRVAFRPTNGEQP